MSTRHVVRRGEVLETIARRHGVSVEAIRHAPENEALWRTRSPNVLFDGDEVHVPTEAAKSVMLEHDQIYTFVFRPRTQPVAFRFCRAGVPRRHEPVEWRVDDEEATTTRLDAGGWLRTRVPLGSERLRIVLDPGTVVAQTRVVRLGHLDPHVEPVGAQQRLNNLGFSCGAEDGDVAARTKAAVELFQTTHGLPVTGSLDEHTAEALVGKHGI